MSTTLTLTIIGANEDITTTETPTLTALSALDGYVAMTCSAVDGGFEPVLESEETVYADKHTYVAKTITGVYKVKLKFRQYPAADTSIFAYVPELAVLRKAYNWIRIDGYKIGFETANIARAVNLISWNVNKFHDWTQYEFEFKFREPF